MDVFNTQILLHTIVRWFSRFINFSFFLLVPRIKGIFTFSKMMKMTCEKWGICSRENPQISDRSDDDLIFFFAIFYIFFGWRRFKIFTRTRRNHKRDWSREIFSHASIEIQHIFLRSRPDLTNSLWAELCNLTNTCTSLRNIVSKMEIFMRFKNAIICCEILIIEDCYDIFACDFSTYCLLTQHSWNIKIYSEFHSTSFPFLLHSRHDMGLSSISTFTDDREKWCCCIF